MSQLKLMPLNGEFNYNHFEPDGEKSQEPSKAPKKKYEAGAENANATM